MNVRVCLRMAWLCLDPLSRSHSAGSGVHSCWQNKGCAKGLEPIACGTVIPWSRRRSRTLISGMMPRSVVPCPVLFLYREGHISVGPHYVPRDEALILAANQQRVLGAQALVQVL